MSNRGINLATSFILALAMLAACGNVCQAQPREPRTETQRILALSPAGPKVPPKTLKAYRDRFAGKWSNPASEHDLILKNNGDWVELKPGGNLVSKGAWKIATESTAVAAYGHQMGARLSLVTDSVLAIQEIAPDGSPHGNGTVRFRGPYDWSLSSKAPAADSRLETTALTGTWTHPNLKNLWEVSQDGTWVERRKLGGDVVRGTTHRVAEEGFVVALKNGYRLRMWPIADDVLALIAVSPQGSLVQDGLIISRVR
jgi:hypothetical protein